ncbi:putative polyamine transporter-like, partial [Capsicum annuum]
MLLQSWSCPSAASLRFPNRHNTSIYNNQTTKILVFPCLRKPLPKLLCLRGFAIDDITDVIHNKVLVAAAVSAAIGQLMKPFTSSLFYGNEFNFKTAFQAGGFPSTHSSAVVATATALGLER